MPRTTATLTLKIVGLEDFWDTIVTLSKQNKKEKKKKNVMKNDDVTVYTDHVITWSVN